VIHYGPLMKRHRLMVFVMARLELILMVFVMVRLELILMVSEDFGYLLVSCVAYSLVCCTIVCCWPYSLACCWLVVLLFVDGLLLCCWLVALLFVAGLLSCCLLLACCLGSLLFGIQVNAVYLLPVAL
jgi:hypothetical protein